MKTALKALIFGISIIILISCGKDNSSPNPQDKFLNKIMPLGASRVEGNRPVYESFRYELWKDLTENNWAFDFIGTQSDNATYPTFNNNNFDSILFDFKSIIDSLKYKNAMYKNAIYLTLGYNTAIFNVILNIFNRINIINMDGIEWKRAKWGFFVKVWFYFNDKIAKIVSRESKKWIEKNTAIDVIGRKMVDIFNL